MVEIFYKPNFVRQYNKLGVDLQEEIEQKIELFCKNPNHPFLKTHKLKGKLKGRLSFSVNYEYRIVFRYKTKKSVVLLAVGNHNVYN